MWLIPIGVIAFIVFPALPWYEMQETLTSPTSQNPSLPTIAEGRASRLAELPLLRHGIEIKIMMWAFNGLLINCSCLFI